ncbi:MAG TPA: ABC transporter permease [Terriglobales bacterium]|nr:ABC transporter permease [Terriglobales bacterium]
MGSLGSQIRQVFRRLRRAPLFTAVVLVTVAIGVGANTTIFSVVEGVLLKPLPYKQPDRLIGVWYKAPAINIPKINMAEYLYFTDREQSKTLEDIGLYGFLSFHITGGAQPEQVQGLEVTDGTLPILGVQPALGRLFTRRDDSPNMPLTVILTNAFWQRHFGGDTAVVGRTLKLDGEMHEIIGILPADFVFMDRSDVDVIVPGQIDRSKTTLGGFSTNGLARLKPGVTLQQATADLTRLVPIATHSFPPPSGFGLKMFEEANFTPSLEPLKIDVIGDIGNVLWVLMGSIVIVLLVACANVANLLLVRVEGRRQELAIRAALGANRRNMIAGMLLESLVLGCAGSAIGLGLAYGALQMIIAAAPTGLPRLHEIGIDIPVLLFTAGLAIFVSLVIGMIPVPKYTGIKATTGLREGGRGLSQSRERHRARKTLVVVQVALALVLLICSGLMIRTFRALTRVFPGFSDPNTIASFDIFIPTSQVPDTNRIDVLRMQQAIANQLSAVPGVSSVAISSSLPMIQDRSLDPVYASDHSYKEGDLPPLSMERFISPGFFKTMGIPLIAGRDMTWDEELEKRPVVMVSENLARKYWGSPAAAIGKLLRVGANDPWHEVIGVVGDVYDNGVNQDPPTSVYWGLFQGNWVTQKELVRRYVHYVIRTPRAGSASFFSDSERAVWSVNHDLPLAYNKTIGELYTKSMARTSFTLVLLSVAGAMTLLLGIIGLYGVIAYAISQRTREIGIRMALGAQREALTGMFVRQGLVLTGIGVLCGVGVAFATMRLMSSLLYHVSPVDPWTYIAATLSIAIVAWLATYVPSRKAAVVNPVHALRAE